MGCIDDESNGENMKYRLIFLAISTIACLALQACTHQAWYEGFKAKQRQDCYDNHSQDEIQQCLDRVNSVTYEEYEKERERTGE